MTTDPTKRCLNSYTTQALQHTQIYTQHYTKASLNRNKKKQYHILRLCFAYKCSFDVPRWPTNKLFIM